MFRNSACVTKGPLLEGPEEFWHPESCMITELFYSHVYEQRLPTYKKFQAYTLLCFLIQINEKWLYGPEKFPGLSRNALLVGKAVRLLDLIHETAQVLNS